MTDKKANDQDVVYARLHDPENMRWLFSIMAETNQPMRAVIEQMIRHCRRKNSSFSMPVRQTAAEKAVAKQKEREERLRAKAAGSE